LPNKPLVFSVNITNITDSSVTFDIRYPSRNIGWYNVEPHSAVMPPRSTQRILVKMTQQKKELEDRQYEDAFTVYSCLTREGVEASDFVDRVYYEVGKELPIFYKKVISLIMQCMCSNFNVFLIRSEIRRLPCMI
jgi:hypothetical protein